MDLHKALKLETRCLRRLVSYSKQEGRELSEGHEGAARRWARRINGLVHLLRGLETHRRQAEQLAALARFGALTRPHPTQDQFYSSLWLARCRKSHEDSQRLSRELSFVQSRNTELWRATIQPALVASTISPTTI